jgi:hypothetical protein
VTAPTVIVEVDFQSDLSAGLAYSEQVIQTAPFAYYQLRETSGSVAASSSGNGRDGAYAGTVTLGGTAGKPVTGEAAARYVTFGADGRVTFTGTAPPDTFTVEAWIYVSSLASVAEIFGNGGTAAGAKILNVWVGTDGKLHSQVGSVGVGGETHVTSAAVISTAAWFHVAYVFDGPRQLGQFYVNGAAVDTVAVGGAIAWSTSNVTTAFKFGRYTTNAVGRLAEPAFYLEALQAGTVADHYAAAATPPFAGYTWTDVTPYVLMGEGIERRLGRDSQLSEVTPHTVAYTLVNDDRRFEVGYEGDNLQVDGSFETGRLTEGWRALFGTPYVTSHAADYAHKAAVNANGWRVVSVSTGQVAFRSRKKIAVDPSLPYVLSGYFRTDTGTAAQSTLRLRCYDSSGTVFLGTVWPNQSVAGLTYAGGHFDPPGTFTRYGGRVSGQTGTHFGSSGGFMPGTAFVEVEVYLQYTATVFGVTTGVVADAFRLEQASAVSAYTSAPYYPRVEPGRPTRVRLVV